MQIVLKCEFWDCPNNITESVNNRTIHVCGEINDCCIDDDGICSEAAEIISRKTEESD